jgi:tRNA-splicing ligase RtcB
MSRGAAANSITHELLKDTLKQHGVKLLGGGLDEAPQAYKNIGEVMRSQGKLVDTIGLFTPKIVRMDG